MRNSTCFKPSRNVKRFWVMNNNTCFRPSKTVKRSWVMKSGLCHELLLLSLYSLKNCLLKESWCYLLPWFVLLILNQDIIRKLLSAPSKAALEQPALDATFANTFSETHYKTIFDLTCCKSYITSLFHLCDNSHTIRIHEYTECNPPIRIPLNNYIYLVAFALNVINNVWSF